MTRQGMLIALVVVVVGLFFLGASPFFIVDVTQNAIVVQLGKPVRNLNEAGLYTKIPFFEEVTYFDKRLLDYDSDAQDVITQDKKTLLLDNFAKWRITDPLKVYRAAPEPARSASAAARYYLFRVACRTGGGMNCWKSFPPAAQNS